MDVYLPASQPAADSNDGLPVVLFCHGGVWAAGVPSRPAAARLGYLPLVLRVTVMSEVVRWKCNKPVCCDDRRRQVALCTYGHTACECWRAHSGHALLAVPRCEASRLCICMLLDIACI